MSCPFPKSKITTLTDDQFQNGAKAPDVNSYSSSGPCGKGGFLFCGEAVRAVSGGQSAAAQPWQLQLIYRSVCGAAPSDGADGIDGGAGSHQDHHNAEPW